jgi:hypothetical protein
VLAETDEHLVVVANLGRWATSFYHYGGAEQISRRPQGPDMHITEFEQRGDLFHGTAVSTRGQLYRFVGSPDGDVAAYRELPHQLPDGRRFWAAVTAPTALVREISKRCAN